ncbi:MAG TPA: NRDE family protein [Rhodanobacteraceae bacterium]|nr:NRDE family protein [Rhodanobacteraceae bacterium]
MCVIAFAWCAHPRWRLLLVGNRDELHARASAPLAGWVDAPGLIAGRDLVAGGSWMGVARSGRVAVVTNVRDPRASLAGGSRGLLVTDFLRGADSAAIHAVHLAVDAVRYRPFNLLLFDQADARFVSNRPTGAAAAIAPGVHGLSNAALDEPWPKVRRTERALADWLAHPDGFASLMDALHDENPAPDAELPDTGVGIERERLLSPVFVRGRHYGTRATTLIAIEHDGTGVIVERRFGPDGVALGETRQAFTA